MSLNMFLSSADTQARTMNQICIDTIQAMEEVKKSIDQFILSFLLQGKTYQTAKAYMGQSFRPLAQGIIYLCEELIRQNEQYPRQFRSQVSSSDIIEQEILDQIEQIDALIRRLRDSDNPFVGPTIQIYEGIKRSLEAKLERLYEYNTAVSSNYDTALQLAQAVAQGLAEVQGGKGFDPKTKTFALDGMELDWVAKLEKIHYTRKANELYGEHLEEYPEDLEKIIAIIKYEERNKKYLEQTNEFLEVLELKDTIEIKYLIYTADEPYRTLSLKYLDDITLASINGPGVFKSGENSLSFDVEKDRTNLRGPYFTFFHELGHAIDYNYAKEIGMEGFFSNNFTTSDQTLSEYMHLDVENRVRMELKIELEKAEYDHLDNKTKLTMINNIKEYLIYDGPSNIELTSDEEEISEIIKTKISNELRGDEHHNASDVYGGVTVNEIVGKWGHHDQEYWIDPDSGERVNEPNKEGFASYFGTIMLDDGDIRDKQIASLEEFLPDSKKHMDEMFESINEGDK